MEIIYLLILILAILAFLFFTFHFQWSIKELRDICSNESCYLKLIQLIFVLLIFGSFAILLIDTLIHR
jgi:hypothetical protein